MYPKWNDKYCYDDEYKVDHCGCTSEHYMPKKYKPGEMCDYSPKMHKMHHEDCCQMPKMACKTEKKCVKTYTCTYKLYKMCHYCLYKVCPRCGAEFDYHHHHGMCPKCD